MGTWGTSLYANDSICDVRDAYLGFLEKQASNQEAYEKTLEKYKEYIGDQDEPLFWFALAETQWRVGRLMPEVKEKALGWMEKDGGLELWEESKDKDVRWEKTLEKLHVKLESEQPKEKRFRKINIPFQNPWNLNDVYAYRVHKKCVHEDEAAVYGKYILMQKIGEGICSDSDDTIMRIQIFDRLFDEVPSFDDALETIRNYQLLPFSNPLDQRRRYRQRLLGKPDPFDMSQAVCIFNPLKMSALLEQYYNPSYPKDEATYICTVDSPPNKQHERTDGNATAILTWDEIHYKIGRMFALWKNIGYDVIGDGTFEYPTREQQTQISPT